MGTKFNRKPVKVNNTEDGWNSFSQAEENEKLKLKGQSQVCWNNKKSYKSIDTVVVLKLHKRNE